MGEEQDTQNKNRPADYAHDRSAIKNIASVWTVSMLVASIPAGNRKLRVIRLGAADG